jgi:hypothetical protein
MLMNKSVSAAELVAARRLIRRAGMKVTPREGTTATLAGAPVAQPAAPAPTARVGVDGRDDRAPAAWKKTVWAETAFEPRG